MSKSYFCLFFFVYIFFSNAQKKYDYVSAPIDSISNVFFNETIEDPYQWMESRDDDRLTQWLESQRKLTRKIENKIPIMSLRSKMGTMQHGVREKEIDGNIVEDKAHKSKYQFKSKNQNYNRSPNLLYRLREQGNYKRLIDAKDYMIDRDDNVSVTGRFVNEEHDLAAITMSHKGSDWQELYFFNLKSGQPMVNSLKYLRTGSHVIWDEKNVYYDRYDPSDEGRELLDKAKGQKLYYHKFGTEQSEDKLLFINPDTTGTNSFNFKKIKDKLFFYNSYKYNGQLYKALSVAKVDSTRLDLENFLIYPNDRKIDITIEQVFVDKVILSTNWNAPNGRVLVVDLNNPNKPVELIPEYDVILRQVNRLGKGKIACIYRNENRDLALIFDLEGKLLKKIDFPEGKKVNNFYENSESADYTDFQVSSFYHPDLWYQLSLSNLTFKPTVEISVPYDPESLETRYIKYTSKDGTQIPMYITCMKDTKLNGKNPTLLYGYGGYGTTVEPSYDDSMALWLIHGGILAVPNVRGGGAVGSDWGLEGRRLKKQNTIDDFIAAAEYLIKENYTSSNNLGATGGSHGALLVGSAVIQKPELFKAVVAEAGPYDMLRFGMFTVGDVSTNINEFGTVTDQNDYKNLRSYSPLHNIKEGVKYSNVLLITGDHDDRVPPLHSYKFLATLQQKASSESLYLLYVIAGAGHSGGLTNNDRVDKILYEYAFLYDQLF